MKAEKQALVRRLKIIQGQVEGIIKMIESDVPECEKVMTQMKAVKSAFQSAGGEVVKLYLKSCLQQKSEEVREAETNKVLDLFAKF